MSMRKRYLEHMKKSGALPEGFDGVGMSKGYAQGGMVEHDDEWMDGDWNEHEDTSGEPMSEGDNYMEEGYAFGGRIKVPEDQQSMQSLHGKDYGRPNFAGPKEHSQSDDMMSEDEVRSHLARAVRRGRR